MINLLIGEEGASSSKMLTHFLRAVIILGSLFNVLREKRVKGRPRRSDSDEEASGPPAIAKCLQRKSTGTLFNKGGLPWLIRKQQILSYLVEIMIKQWQRILLQMVLLHMIMK
ncbi:hypothetical protein FSZ17_19685 [Cytobacillus dafuensis]|uniref:Uncharacterized protein n=1 Tax=Cytobacillus dafuensis TaxID=1742359 RepID=A0A5B8Z891_CYTDA|nr:hypothetical protein FSZ17_19685 [Cytobacillus dafuensis]